MNCNEVKKQIELYVLSELNQTERLEIEAHLLHCSDCRTLESEYRQIVTELRQSAREQSTGPEFERNILLSVENEIRGITSHTALRRVAVIAAVACVFISLALWQLWIYLAADIKPDYVESSSGIQSGVISYSIPAHARALTASAADNIVVRGHYIYLLLDDGPRSNIAAIDTITGKQKWKSDIESYGYITLDQTRLFCLAPGEKGGLDLVALDVFNGRTVWRYQQEISGILHGPCPPIILPGNRICWTNNTTIYMLRSSDGEVLWAHEITDENMLSTATLANNAIYVAGVGGLYCLDAASGNQLWQSKYDFKVSQWARPLLAVHEERICAAIRIPKGQSRLFCMDLAAKKMIWTKTVPQVSHLCVAENRLFLRSQSVQAIDMTDGASLWSFASTGCSPLTFADGLIWFVDSTDKGQLVALYERTGIKSLELTGIRSCNAFVELDNKGYVKTHDGVVHVVLFKG